MRYTLATGEPVFTGFMRTRPSSTLWAWVYAGLYFLQVGWPAWAATAAGAIFFLFARRLAGPADAATIYFIGVGDVSASASRSCSVGRRIERTLELLNWVLVVCILGGFLVAGAARSCPRGTWLAARRRARRLRPASGRVRLLPGGRGLLPARCAGRLLGRRRRRNIMLSNWARDKGYGMGERAGLHPGARRRQQGAPRAHRLHLRADAESDAALARLVAHRPRRSVGRVLRRRHSRHGAAGAALRDVPAARHRHPGPRHQRRARAGVGGDGGRRCSAASIAFLGAWILFKTQLDNLEGMVRAITDILWTGQPPRPRLARRRRARRLLQRARRRSSLWGIIALRLAQPIVLLQIGANVAGVVFIIASLHLLYVNTRLLPRARAAADVAARRAGRDGALLRLLRRRSRWGASSDPRKSEKGASSLSLRASERTTRHMLLLCPEPLSF